MTRRNLLLACWLSVVLVGALSSAFASGISSNLWEFRKHVEEGGAPTITAVMLDKNHPPAEYNPNAPGGYDDHGYGLDLTAPARLVFNTGYDHSTRMKFTAGYYRRPIYSTRGSRGPFAGSQGDSTNYVSVFSNAIDPNSSWLWIMARYTRPPIAV